MIQLSHSFIDTGKFLNSLHLISKIKSQITNVNLNNKLKAISLQNKEKSSILFHQAIDMLFINLAVFHTFSDSVRKKFRMGLKPFLYVPCLSSADAYFRRNFINADFWVVIYSLLDMLLPLNCQHIYYTVWPPSTRINNTLKPSRELFHTFVNVPPIHTVI